MRPPARPPLEAPFRRVGDRPGSSDRQAELTRLYYPSGQLQAERWRFRERYSEAPQEEAPGCLAFLVSWFKTSVVVSLWGLWCFGAYAFFDAWWGWVLGAASAGLGLSLILEGES